MKSKKANKTDLVIPDNLPGVGRKPKQAFRVYWNGKIWNVGDACQVHWQLSQTGYLQTFPIAMNERHDPVLYSHAIALMDTGYFDDLGTAIYEGDLLLCPSLVKERDMIGVVTLNVSEYIVCFVSGAGNIKSTPLSLLKELEPLKVVGWRVQKENGEMDYGMV